MQKIFLILALTFSYALNAAIGRDQLVQVTFPRSIVMERAIEICKEGGFSHFFITKISYKDQCGQLLLFQGVPQNKEGTLLSETITEEFDSPLDLVQVEFESIFYKEPPNDPLAIKWNYGWDLTNPIKPMQHKGKYQILDQSTQLIFSISNTLKRALEICKEKKFNYFLIKKISYSDERGQSLLFKGIPKTEGGVLISETIVEEFDPPVGKLQAEFEIFFFKEAPSHPLAVIVGEVFGFLH